MLTEALNLATQRLAAAQLEQHQFHEGEVRATTMLHAAAAEVEVLRSVSRAVAPERDPTFPPLESSTQQPTQDTSCKEMPT